MVHAARPSGLSYEAEERALRYTTDYLRRLLIERPYIRAALVNPGGSVILTGVAATTETPSTYSSVVGNDFHLDLLEAEKVIAELPADQRVALTAWADGLSSKQAAQWFHIQPGALRVRRMRAMQRVAQEMSGVVPQEGGEPGGTGGQDAQTVGVEEGSSRGA